MSVQAKKTPARESRPPAAQGAKKAGPGRPRKWTDDNPRPPRGPRSHIKVYLHGELLAYVQSHGGSTYLRGLAERDLRGA